MSIIYLNKKENITTAIPINKIDAIQFDDFQNILIIQTGSICHSVSFVKIEQAKAIFDEIINKIEEFYNKKEK